MQADGIDGRPVHFLLALCAVLACSGSGDSVPNPSPPNSIDRLEGAAEEVSKEPVPTQTSEEAGRYDESIGPLYKITVQRALTAHDQLVTGVEQLAQGGGGFNGPEALLLHTDSVVAAAAAAQTACGELDRIQPAHAANLVPERAQLPVSTKLDVMRAH